MKATDVVKANMDAYVAKDRAALEALIAPDFHFSSPLDNRIDRQTYFERCWPNSARLDHFDIIRLESFGDTVVVTYEGHGKDGKVFRNTEVMTVRGDQIIEVEVYFGWNVPHKAKTGRFIDESATVGHP